MALDCGNHGVSRELLNVIPKEQTSMKRPTTGETALHLAMKKKDLEMMRLLVDNGANTDAQNVCPLHLIHSNYNLMYSYRCVRPLI